MAKLPIAFAVLAVLTLASAAGFEPLLKPYKTDDGSHGEHEGNHVTVGHEGYKLSLKHKAWTLEEKVGKTHPCAEEFKILGSTVTEHSGLWDDGKEVGSVSWSGSIVKHALCKHCKEYQSKSHHDVEVNYEVIFDIEDKGQIIGMVAAGSIFATDKVVVAVVGGTGVYTGIKGTVTWIYGPPNKYTFNVYLPKVHKDDDGKHKDNDDDDDDGKHNKHNGKDDDKDDDGKHNKHYGKDDDKKHNKHDNDDDDKHNKHGKDDDDKHNGKDDDKDDDDEKY